MRTFFLSLCTVILLYNVGFGQEKQDVIYLKNGDVRKGEIVENVPNDYIKVETTDGSIFTIKYAEIEKITKEAKLTPTTQSSSVVPDAQKLMMYESGKKNPTLGVLLSCLLTSAGHAYADNWGRGLLFTAGRVAGAVVAVTAGIKTSTDEYGIETTEITPAYYIGMGISIVLMAWEMIDASAEVDRYNARLYEQIMGKKSDVGLNLVPTKEGGGKLVLSYSF